MGVEYLTTRKFMRDGRAVEASIELNNRPLRNIVRLIYPCLRRSAKKTRGQKAFDWSVIMTGDNIIYSR